MKPQPKTPTAAGYDPYALSPADIQEPPQRFGQALLKIGPGLILAGSIVGTGELIATTNLGAQAGFALLWLVMLSCFIKVFVQIELGRYAISSGETTLTAFHNLSGPGRLMVWWCLAMIMVTQMQIGAMVGGVAQAFHMALPGVAGGLSRPEVPWAVFTAVMTAILLGSGSYRVVELGTTLMVVAFTIMTVVCVALLPATQHGFDWREMASGLSFQLPADALMAAFAMFGITGVGASELLAYPYWCVEKGYARYVGPRHEAADWVARARGWLGVMRLDAWVSMLVYTVATLAFYLLGAAVLHVETGGKGIGNKVDVMLATLAKMYEPVMGPRAATWFIVVGAFAVLYSTLFAATAGNSRMLTDIFRVTGAIRLTSHEHRKRWIRGLCIGLPFLGLALFLGFTNPVMMVTVGGIMQGITLPLIGGCAVYLRYRRTDRRITSGLIWDIFLWLSLVGLTVTAVYSIVSGATSILGAVSRS